MVRKMFCAMFVMTVAVGIVLAEEATGRITKVDGNKFTFQKTKKGKADGDEIQLTLAKDGVVAKAKFNKEAKKVEKGDAIEGGLTNKLFAAEKGVTARVTWEGTTASEVLVLGGKGVKKKKKDAQ